MRRSTSRIEKLVERAAFGGREKAHLRRGAALGCARQPRHPGLVEFALFQIVEDLPRALDYAGGKAGESRHLDSVAAAGRSLYDPPQKDHLAGPFPHRHREIGDPRPVAREVGQLMEVGREQHLGAGRVVQVLGDRPRNRQPVKGARAAPDFVEQEQASRREIRQQPRRLAHLDHEGGLAAPEARRALRSG